MIIDIKKFIICAMPLSAMLNDAFLFELFGVYITPYKLILVLSLFFLILNENISTKIYPRNFSFIFRLFLLFNLILILSVLYSSIGASRKINYILILFIELIIIIYVANITNLYNINLYVNKLSSVLLFIFFASIILATLQLLFKDQILGIGLFSKMRITYSITGFNVERLFLNEFLIVGLVVIWQRNTSLLYRMIILLWVTIIIVSTASFTGIIGLTIIMSFLFKQEGYFKLLSAKNVLAITVIFVVIGYTSMRLIGDDFYDKYENRIINYEESSWRFFSSVYLLNNFKVNPTFIGHGYLTNSKYLSEANFLYTRKNLGADRANSKKMTSHTFISILYDQGLIGFIVFLFYLIVLIFHIMKLFRKVGKSDLLGYITFVMITASLLRFLFYYHAINHWHYLLGIILLNFYLKNSHEKK